MCEVITLQFGTTLRNIANCFRGLTELQRLKHYYSFNLVHEHKTSFIV